VPLSPQDLTQRVQPFLEPISAAAPSGGSARYEPEYERILAEVGKLEAPTGGTVDWLQVATLGKKLLGSKSKDLLLAAYTGFALFAPKKSLAGLLDGMVLVSELTDRYWDSLFPDAKRQKARANAVGWFVQRVSIAVGDVVPGSGERDVVEALVPAAQRLADICRARFTEGGPAFGPLMEALERVRLQLPPEAPPPPPAPEPAAAPPSGSNGVPAPAPATGAPAAAASALPTRGADATGWLREVGTALCQAAADLRRAGPADPTSYRVLRAGLWLHLTQAPPRGPDGRCPFPPLPADQRAQLQALAANGKWMELLEESESVLLQHRFQLDPHRFSAAALAGLGHTAARSALVAELGAWLRRVPEVPELSASDGSPAADAQTRAWLDLEVRGGGGTAPGSGGADATAEAVGEAKSLFATGKGAEALALLQSRVQTADSGRARFRLRLELAKLCAPNQPAVARALYAALARECTAHDLDTWEPALTAECLEGLLSSRASGALSEEDSGYFQRLCRISPSAAARVQT